MGLGGWIDNRSSGYGWIDNRSFQRFTMNEASGGGDSGGSGGGDSGGGDSGGGSGGSGDGDSGGGDSGGSGGSGGGDSGGSGGSGYAGTLTGTCLWATAASDTQINLSWSGDSGGESGYTVQQSADGGTWTDLGSIGADVTSYSATGLTAETMYYYRLEGASSNLCRSNTAYATTRPAAPTDFTVTAITGSQATLSWQGTAHEQDYYYVEQLGEDSAWAGVSCSQATSTTATISESFDPSTRYTFRVTVSSQWGNSALSDAATVTTAAWPTAPSDLTATPASASEIDLAWTDNATDATAYQVERSADGSAWTSLATLGADATTYSETDLPDGTLYDYRVSATNDYGDSGYAKDSAETPLAAPSELEVTPLSGSETSFLWQVNSTASPSYSVQQLVGADWQVVAETDPDSTGGILTGSFDPSTEYDFRVQAFSDWAQSVPTDAVAVTTPAWPAAPTALTATAASDTEVDLAWTNNATDATGYNVESSPDEDTWTLLTTLSADATTYSDTGLPEATLYHYRASATNSDGDSAYTTAATTSMLVQPTGLEATAVNGNDMVLQWDDNSGAETAYSVEQLIDSDWQQVATRGADFTSASLTGPFDSSTQYEFRVQAISQSAHSLPSDVATVTTPALPAAPTDLTATPACTSQIDLTWTDNATDATACNVARSWDDGATWNTVAVLAADATTYSDTGLSDGTLCYYRVWATNGAWGSGFATAAAATPIAQPTELQVTASSGSGITLQWQANSVARPAYSVQQVVDGTWTEVATTDPDPSAVIPDTTTATVMGPFDPSTQYQFRVQAVSYWSESPASDALTFTTPAWPPAPTNLTATAISGVEIDLSWSPSAGAAGYFVQQRCADSSDNWTVLGVVSATQTTYAATGLTPGGADYSFCVLAVNGAGTSASSASADAQTQEPSAAITPPNAAGGITRQASAGSPVYYRWGGFDASWVFSLTQQYDFRVVFIQKMTVEFKDLRNVQNGQALASHTITYFEWLHRRGDLYPGRATDAWHVRDYCFSGFQRGRFNVTGTEVWTSEVQAYKLTNELENDLLPWRPASYRLLRAGRGEIRKHRVLSVAPGGG